MSRYSPERCRHLHFITFRRVWSNGSRLPRLRREHQLSPRPRSTAASCATSSPNLGQISSLRFSPIGLVVAPTAALASGVDGLIRSGIALARRSRTGRDLPVAAGVRRPQLLKQRYQISGCGCPGAIGGPFAMSAIRIPSLALRLSLAALGRRKLIMSLSLKTRLVEQGVSHRRSYLPRSRHCPVPQYFTASMTAQGAHGQFRAKPMPAANDSGSHKALFASLGSAPCH